MLSITQCVSPLPSSHVLFFFFGLPCTLPPFQSSSLSHHRVVHTDQGLRPYVCRHNRCGATYTQLARLITHQRTTHSGMILFIPQESSSANSSPQSQSQAASATTTPSGNTPDDPFPNSPSQTPVPSGYESTLVPVSAAGISLESNNSAPRPSTPVNMNESSRNSIEGAAEDKDKDKDRARSTSKKEKGTTAVARTPISAPQQTIPPSKRSMIEQQRSHTASPAPHTTTSGNDNISMNGAPRPVSSTGYHSDESSRSMGGGGGYDGAREVHQENEQDPDDLNEEEETDEMRQRREAALTMASFKDVVRVEQPQQQQQPSGQHAPTPPPPSAGYYSQTQQPHGGHNYPSSDARNPSPMYPPGPSSIHNNSHPPTHHMSSTGQPHHHHAYPPQQQPQQQQQQYSTNNGDKYWGDGNNNNSNSSSNNSSSTNNKDHGPLARGTVSGLYEYSSPGYSMHHARRLNSMAVRDGPPPPPQQPGDKRNINGPHDQEMYLSDGIAGPMKGSTFGPLNGSPFGPGFHHHQQRPQQSSQQHQHQQQQHGGPPQPTTYNRSV